MRAPVTLLAAFLLLGSPALTFAEKIGTAVHVDPDVRGHLAGAPSRDLAVNDAIQRGLRVQLTGESPALEVAFNFGGCLTLQGPRSYQFTGTASLDGRSEVDFGDPSDPAASRIRLALGRLLLALLPEARCRLEVRSPNARIDVQGTSLRMLVDPAVGTFVAVDEGEVSVQAVGGEGEALGGPVLVRAGQWVIVPPDGLPTRLPPRETDRDFFDDPPLLDCCAGTEPPKPPEPRP